MWTLDMIGVRNIYR